MSKYHYQCEHCGCTTDMWEEDDGRDDFYGGMVGDCGCESFTIEDDYDDDWDDD